MDGLTHQRDSADRNLVVKIKVDTFDLTPAVRGFRGTSGLSVARSSTSQVLGGLRKNYVTFADRKNRQRSMSFSSHYEFTTVDDGEQWILDLDEKLPNQGLVEITTNANARRRWLPGALVRCETRQIGLLVVASFRIDYAEVLKEKPAAT